MPFSDGEDHGGADDEFASVVFDESFIRAAAVHEPTAEERLLAAAKARADAEARTRVGAADDDPDDDVRYGEDLDPFGRRPAGTGQAVRPYSGLGAYGMPHYGGYRGHSRWHRTVAWVLALVMGIGVVALTFTAVYRGAAGSRRPSPPPASGRVDSPRSPAGVTSSVAP